MEYKGRAELILNRTDKDCWVLVLVLARNRPSAIGEGWRRLEKVGGGWRRLEKVGEGRRRLE